MSVIQSIKSAVGLNTSRQTYECVDCGSTFESTTEPGSHWFECMECGSKSPLEADDE